MGVEGFADGDVVEHEVMVAGRVVRLAAPRSPHVLPECQDEPEDLRRLPFWARVWPSSAALAEQLARGEAESIRGQRVIELGCGLGLAGIGAALAGARVTWTDRSPTALAFVRENLRRNAIADGRTELLAWSLEPAAPAEPFPLAIGADLCADPRAVAPLFATLRAVLAPDGVAMLVDPLRAGLQPVEQAARACGMQLTVLARFPPRPDLPPATIARPYAPWLLRASPLG